MERNITWLKKFSNPIVEMVQERVRNQLPNDICFMGSRGCGKTWALLSIAPIIDPSFSAERICISAKSLFRLLKKMKGMDTRGKVIVFEEVQDTLYNKRVTTVESVEIIRLLSKYRALGIVCLISTPVETQLNKDMRDYFTMKLIGKGVDRKRKVGKFRWFVRDDIALPDGSVRWYSPVFKVIHAKKREYVTIRELWFTTPPMDLVTTYEEFKRQYIFSTGDEAIMRIEKKEKKLKDIYRISDGEPLGKNVY